MTQFKRARKRAGLSREAAAYVLHVPIRTIINLDRGILYPRGSVLQAIVCRESRNMYRYGGHYLLPWGPAKRRVERFC